METLEQPPASRPPASAALLSNNNNNINTASQSIHTAHETHPSRLDKQFSSQADIKAPQRTRTGSALTLQEALRICRDYHESHHHCGKDKLKTILYEAIPDATLRPHSRHIKEFVCGPCAMAKSHVPPQRKTHPLTPSPEGFLPGEFLFVDGSGAYKFPTLDNTTQHFIVTCATSHAKFAFPTADKSPSTLLEVLKTLENHWQTKIRKIRTDQEYSKSIEIWSWAVEHGVAIEETPPYVKAGNGKAERAHSVIQNAARTYTLQAGAPKLLWPYACRYAAKILNGSSTSADKQRRSPITIAPNIPFQHRQLERPPWGCEMFAHLDQKTLESSAVSARARPGVFVGICDNGPEYLLYDLEHKKVRKVGYAIFNTHNFPLKNRLVAGQSIPTTEPVDPNGFLRAAPLTPDEISDALLAEYVCLSHLYIDVPVSFFPEYKHSWRLQCSRPHKRKQSLSCCSLRHVPWSAREAAQGHAELSATSQGNCIPSLAASYGQGLQSPTCFASYIP